ncbi:4561_t:CDS:2 [Acaulospora morrowiae]|uniref:4561_t:CDS:1 n=1 Tax=Acaulospora morrowiae TaxID=94023 RepID=A0A9N9CCF3_9GLOM|nr:4561_t:CDS:2 [Acaulospora morrowiae]
MPSPTDSNPISTAVNNTVITSAQKDSSELSKESRSQQVPIDDKDVTVDNANGVIHDDSDMVANTIISRSSPPFIHDSGLNVVTAASSNSSSVVNTNILNSAQSNDSPVAQKSTQKVSKQHTTQRPPRRTRNSAKVVNTSVQNEKDAATTPGSLSTNVIPIASATGRSLQSIIPASSSPSTTASINAASVVKRNLPQKDVTPENIGDRYLEFILYCNPSAPSDLDVSSLIRSFNAVPKSDGKTFETWVLFQLVSKHHSGEIKTWTKLAQQLGVERTNESSPQKIQQYAVRLKKWMRSIHIDAFFDYILSKPNEYYEEPHKNPTGAELSSGGADDLDESDLVLKLIKRASSKRQKRKSEDDLDEDEDRDAWEDDADDMMHIDNPIASSSKSTDGRKAAGSLRRKSVVQFASTRENIPKLGKPKNILTHNIPTPNPSPTTMPDIKLNHNSSGVTGDAGNFRMVSSPGATGSPGTQLRWRSISVGGGPTSAQASDMSTPQSFLRKQSGDASASGHFDSALGGGPGSEVSKDNSNDGFSYAELLIPPNNVSDPNVTINMLQQRLVKAVGMLEDKQRKIDLLENVVRQREEEVRKRAARGLKEEVINFLQRWE